MMSKQVTIPQCLFEPRIKQEALSSDKATYNKFNYRLRSGPPELKQHWDSLKRSSDEDAMEQSVQTILAAKG